APDRHPRSLGRSRDRSHRADGRRRDRRRGPLRGRGAPARRRPGLAVQRLFGIPMGDLAVGLSIALGLAIGVVAACALRNRFLLRLALRNLTRRPGRSALIVTGLMLDTTIIASALVTGDTMNRTVRASVIESLGRTDERVSVRGTDREGSPAISTSSGAD